MKLSLRWLADHLTYDWQMPSLADIQQMLIKHTAEVDDVYEVHIPRERLYAGLIQGHEDQQLSVFVPELNQTYAMPQRDITFPDGWYLLYITNDTARWAMTTDVGGTKEQPFPPVHLDENAAHSGQWRSALSEYDWIIDIDNAAITHRADLWGHHGFAREIAAIMQAQLRDADQMYADISVSDANMAPYGSYQPHINAKACDRFVSYHIPHLDAHPSAIEMASRLARVGVRPHNLLVDITNYVMYDIGQPMHVFDVRSLPDRYLTVRYADENEQMEALDGTQIELIPEDMVVASGKTPLSVAGVIGGRASGVQEDTRGVVLEAAHFDPTAIRLTSTRIKRRTESSMRFEKNVDPYKTDLAIQRYMALLSQHGIAYTAADTAYAAGSYPELPHITISHAMIEQRIGLSIPYDRISQILHALGCSVTQSDDDGYTIAVPSYRRNDITRPEDIIEEIARIVGYDHIPLTLPHRPMYPRSLQSSARVRTIKQHCAYALSMREITSYALYDEQWLNELQWEPSNAVTIANPVSENMYRLVTSLVPHMLHAVASQAQQYHQLRFFEWAKAWRLRDSNAVQEDECLTAIIYDKQKSYDLYQFKAEMSSLFQLLHMQIAWQPVENIDVLPDWYDPQATARIMYAYNGDWYDLGYAGKVADDMCDRVASGTAYVFELDGDALRAYTAASPVFYGISKYQSTWFDVSVYVPEGVSVAQLEQCAKGADSHIHDVYLVDVYEDAPDPYVRSVALRITAGAMDRTLSGNEIESIRAQVHNSINQCGVEIR